MTTMAKTKKTDGDDGWISRNRKRKLPTPTPITGGSAAVDAVETSELSTSASIPSSMAASSMLALPHSNSASSAATASASVANPTSKEACLSSLPPSLIPHLGWTKLSKSCPVPNLSKKKKKRRNRRREWKRKNLRDSMAWDDDDAIQTVSGKAIFFIHDPASLDLSRQPLLQHDERKNGTDGDEDDDENDQTSWFQGRFFPSTSVTVSSPTNVDVDLDSTVAKSSSWGLLAVQNDIIDECLQCSEGGYRELDLSVIRHIPRYAGGKKKSIRWMSENIIWTGGDMMRLVSSHLNFGGEIGWNGGAGGRVSGVKFEPTTLMGGEKALSAASKYFPTLFRQLDGNGAFEGGCEAMAVIGDMSISAPASFVRMNSNPNCTRFTNF